MYLRKGNGLLIVIILVVVVGLGLLLIARKNVSTNYQNSLPTSQVTTGNTNADLQQDMNTIDTSMSNTNDASNGVSQGINDTPIPQIQP